MQTHSGKLHSWCQPQPQRRGLISPVPHHTSVTQHLRLGQCTRSEKISHCFDLHFFEYDSLRLLNDFLSVASLHPLIVPGHFSGGYLQFLLLVYKSFLLLQEVPFIVICSEIFFQGGVGLLALFTMFGPCRYLFF